jgi:DNA-binding XRE family transcriptional regulator
VSRPASATSSGPNRFTQRRDAARLRRAASKGGRAETESRDTSRSKDPGPAQLEAVIGWRVRSRAREIGLSSAQLAKRVGLSRAMISKIENAQVSPSLATAFRLAEALEIPITSLFQGGTGRPVHQGGRRSRARTPWDPGTSCSVP